MVFSSWSIEQSLKFVAEMLCVKVYPSSNQIYPFKVHWTSIVGFKGKIGLRDYSNFHSEFIILYSDHGDASFDCWLTFLITGTALSAPSRLN